MISKEISTILEIKLNSSENKYLNDDLTLDWNKISVILPSSGKSLIIQ